MVDMRDPGLAANTLTTDDINYFERWNPWFEFVEGTDILANAHRYEPRVNITGFLNATSSIRSSTMSAMQVH
jgi:hypothetical protein